MPAPSARPVAPALALARRALPVATALAAGAALLGAAAAGAAPAAGAAATAKPSIAITGTSVKDGVVTVKVRIAGWKLSAARMGKTPNAADTGHWHVLVDGKVATMAAARSARTTALTAGTHRITAELANNDHSSLVPPVRSATVTVTVVTSAGAGKVKTPEAGSTTPSTESAPADGDGGGGMYGY